jgi:hypothetical protein
MAHENLSFEEQGAGPGLAAGWTFASTATAEEHATFATNDGGERAGETFEHGWSDPFVSNFDDVAGPAAEYSADFFVTPKAREDFEVGWATDQALVTELGATIAAEYGGQAFEAFETDWATSQAFVTSLDELGTVSAGVETFATGWQNDGYATSLVGGTPADYDGLDGQPVEDFEETFVPLTFSVLAGTDILTIADHDLSDDDRVYVYSTGRLPAGLNRLASYWVQVETGDTIKLSTIPPADGVSIADITDPGFGTHYLAFDPTLVWNLTEEL